MLQGEAEGYLLITDVSFSQMPEQNFVKETMNTFLLTQKISSSDFSRVYLYKAVPLHVRRHYFKTDQSVYWKCFWRRKRRHF